MATVLSKHRATNNATVALVLRNSGMGVGETGAQVSGARPRDAGRGGLGHVLTEEVGGADHAGLGLAAFARVERVARGGVSVVGAGVADFGGEAGGGGVHGDSPYLLLRRLVGKTRV